MSDSNRRRGATVASPGSAPTQERPEAAGVASGCAIPSKLYASRDPYSLSPHYERHILAMIEEDLHSKAAIAAELAHRDAEIERLTREGALRDGELTLALEQYRWANEARKRLDATLREVLEQNDLSCFRASEQIPAVEGCPCTNCGARRLLSGDPSSSSGTAPTVRDGGPAEAGHSPSETNGRKSLPPGPARIAAQIAHATYHIIDDYGGEDAQTGVCSVEIPKHEWDEWNRIVDLLGDDPHEVLHDLIGVNDPEPCICPVKSGELCPVHHVAVEAGGKP